jgi:hypothetical protein
MWSHLVQYFLCILILCVPALSVSVLFVLALILRVHQVQQALKVKLL